MSEIPQGPGWWQASDGRWYPPELYAPPPLPGGGQPWPYERPDAAFAPRAPYPAGSPAKYCVTCGAGLVASAAICPRCGTPVAPRKSRTAAVVMAVFLSFWSFLYTYRSAAWKFWLGLGLDLGTYVLFLAVQGATGEHQAALAALFLLVSTGVWLWAIIDRATTHL